MNCKAGKDYLNISKIMVNELKVTNYKSIIYEISIMVESLWLNLMKVDVILLDVLQLADKIVV